MTSWTADKRSTKNKGQAPGFARRAEMVFLACGLSASGVVSPVRAQQNLTPEQLQELPTYFGFGPLEIFKIDFGIDHLRAADFNDDGLTDLVVANNRKSSLELLLQRKERADPSKEEPETNEIVNDWRFERRSISVNWEVKSLQTAEVTGDRHVDLVFLGGQELVVLPGHGDGKFGDPVTHRVRDASSFPHGLDVGDVNGDGLNDVALLAQSDVLFFLQKKEGGLAPPRRFAHALENPLLLRVIDVNGDARDDLLLMTQEEEYPLHARLQNELGSLGPVQRIKLAGLRSVTFKPVLGRSKADVFGVERVSGRLKRWSLESDVGADDREEWAVQYYPLPGASAAERLPFVIADVDGDGFDDVVTADIESAQLALFRQHAGVGLAPVKLFGGQVKMLDARARDAGGRSEIYILSAEEQSIARSDYREGRLSFPKTLPTLGKPYALDVGPMSADAAESLLVYVTRVDDSAYQLVLQPLDADDVEPKRQRVDIKDMDEPPAGLRLVDVNRDGLNDALIFMPYDPLITFLQTPAGEFKRLGEDGAGQKGLVKNARIEGFAWFDADGDGKKEILSAQKTFVRALYVNENDSWEILDQYNAPHADAEITGVCAWPLSETGRPHLALYDRRSREVYVMAPREGGAYELERSIPVGSFELKAMAAASLDGTGRPDLLLVDAKRLALVLPEVAATHAREVGVYESSVKDARLGDLASGDFNHDGVEDVAVIDVENHFVEILTFAPDASLVRANKFRVFATKQYRGGASDAGEPRWVGVADVTDDRVDDLIMIAHDRILLYPGR